MKDAARELRFGSIAVGKLVNKDEVQEHLKEKKDVAKKTRKIQDEVKE